MRKFEKLTETAILPQRATPGSAGYDLYANQPCYIEPGHCFLVKTGVTFKTSNLNDVLLIHVRSSLTYKKGIMLANGVGVVDADYYPNEIGVMLYNVGHSGFMVHNGDRIAQAIIQTYELTDDDSPAQSERSGGFGSTGK